MIEFETLAKTYGTPLYVYDFNSIENRFDSFKESFKARKSLVAYAVKACSNLSVIRLLAKRGAGADCVSIGEVKRALLAGVPKYKIIFSGVGKSDDEISEALREDILMLNVESEGELDRILIVARSMGIKARVSVRVNPDIDPKTHPYISTGLNENKFGVDVQTAKKMYLYAQKQEWLDPIGIHFHIGSQLTDLEPIYEASQKVATLTRQLIALNIDLKFFDVGGGLGIRYRDEETILPYNYAQVIFSTLGGLDVTLVCEPGRFLVGNAGYFLTRVLYEKESKDKRFVIVDGAMNDLLRPSLYNAYHEVSVCGREKDVSIADVVGPVCESGDFLAKGVKIPKTYHHDLVVIGSVGAYGMSMASNYNTRVRPAEVAIYNEDIFLIRSRENLEQLLSSEEALLQI
jgi:diaminopimelate decarboxylase